MVLGGWVFLMCEVPLYGPLISLASGQRGGNNLNGLKGFRSNHGSNQGQNLAMTGLFDPSSLDSGSVIARYVAIQYGWVLLALPHLILAPNSRGYLAHKKTPTFLGPP